VGFRPQQPHTIHCAGANKYPGKGKVVIQCVIADKQRMTVSAPGGTREVDVPRFLRNTTSLNDEQVIEMAKLALTLETTMGHPVDVESAYAGGELYLLQCRPITTLK
jgi:pyruvate,water dikinase